MENGGDFMVSGTKQQGFTLVELLVVIGILAALFGVVVTNVTGFYGSGDDEANTAEFRAITTAIEVLMADNAILAIAPSTAPTSDFSAFDFDPGAGTVTLYAATGITYLQQNPAKCSYEWVASGQVSSQTGC